MFRFVCVMTSGMPLTEEVRTALLLVGRDLLQAGDEMRIFRAADCEGGVSTEYKYAMLGTFGGVLLDAHVESDRGTTRVRFLLDPATVADIRGDGFWVNSARPEAIRNAACN